MTVDETFQILHAEKELIHAAGPAALRLKLMEIGRMFQRGLADEEVVHAARTASEELRRLISERPYFPPLNNSSYRAGASEKPRAASSKANRAAKETAASTKRRALREEEFDRVADAPDLDQGDLVVLDCVQNRGFSPADFHDYSFLICGIFDSVAEQARVVGRVTELANRRAAASGRESESQQGSSACRSTYKRSA